jgi:uncharacterized protein YycO
MKCGDIIFVKGTSLVSRLIEWWTISKYSHVALVITDLGDFVEATWPKVRTGNVSELPGESIEIGTPVVPLTDQECEALIDSALSKLGKGYDIIGLFSFVFRIRLQNKSFYFCSEFVEEEYASIGRPLLRRKPDWTTPEDIHGSEMLRIVEQ